MTLTGSSSFDQGIAGFFSGAFTTLLLHPLDLIKVRLQVVGKSGLSSKQIIKEIYSLGLGWKGFYRGVTPNLAGATSSWGLYFWFYAMSKDWYKSLDPQKKNLSPIQHLVASAQSGVLVLLLTNPLWVIKTRMCTQSPKDANAYKGLRDGLLKLYRLEGVKGLYKGLVPALWGVSHGALQFMAYEELKKWHPSQDSKIKVHEYLIMASISKIFACVLTYPYQVIRSRMQVENPISKNNVKIASLVSQLYHENNGLRVFYKGLGVNILRILPGTCITFGVYEGLCKLFLSL